VRRTPNYVIGTPAGGKREYQGLEVTLQKFKSNNWQGMLSYTYNDAHGNTNSDSNADFQGDWLAIDPRAPRCGAASQATSSTSSRPGARMNSISASS